MIDIQIFLLISSYQTYTKYLYLYLNIFERNYSSTYFNINNAKYLNTYSQYLHSKSICNETVYNNRIKLQLIDK